MRIRERADLAEAVKRDVLVLGGARGDRRTEHYASDALKKCFRYFFLDWRGEPESNPREDLGTFPVGLAIEDIIVDRIKQAGRYVVNQIRVTIPRRPIPIKGRIDLLMDDSLKRPSNPSWESAVPVEIKSSKDWGERQGWDLWKKFHPREEHIGQLMIYLHRLLELKKIKKDYGYIWVVNKNRAFEEAVYQIYYDSDKMTEIFQWYDDLEKILFQPDVPPIPKGFAAEKYPCFWGSKARDFEGPVGTCKYYDKCWVERRWD